MKGADPKITAKVLAGFDDHLRTYPGLKFGLAQLLDEVGAEQRRNQLPEGWLSLNLVADLLHLAARRTGDDCFGLHFAKALPPGATGVFGFILLNAPDIRSMVVALTRFVKLETNGLDLAFEEADGIARITWTLAPSVTAPTQQLIAFLLALFVDRVCRLLDAKWLPSNMEFTYREPNAAREYEAIFGRNLVFQAAVNRLTAPSASFKRSSPVAKSLLFEALHKIAEEQLARLVPARDDVDVLHKYIIDNVGFGGVDLEGGAKAVGLTTRQLQNELQRRGTSFESEVGQVRRQLATRYLRDTDLPLSEIALMLGYSELSAFTRAARTWFQKSPTQKRAELRASDNT